VNNPLENFHLKQSNDRFRVLPHPYALLVGLACWTTSAQGQTPVELLSWQAPAACPPIEEVQRRLSELQAGGVKNAALQAEVSIEEDANGFHLRLETNLDGLTGERILEGPTCDEVTQAAIAVLALLLDAEAERADELPPSEPPASAPPPARPTPLAPPRPPPPGRAVVSSGPTYYGASGLGAGRGILPNTAVFFEARLGVRGPAWSVQLQGQLWPERAAHSPALTTAGAELSMLGAGLLLCRELLARPVAWRVCSGVQADWLLAQGFGVDDRRQATALSLAVDFGTTLSLPLAGGLALSWSLDGVVPTARPRFVLDNVGVVFERPVVGVRTTLGIELAF